VFVGLEVRETARQTELNTEALHVAAYQNLIGQIAQFNVAMLDPGLAVLYAKIQDPAGDWASLNPVESIQARRILFLLVRHADMAFYQFERGLLTRERLDSALRPFLNDINNRPLYRAFWGETKENFVPSFQAYVDARISGR
jgi:hypothetical protein